MYTVSELNKYVSSLIASDRELNKLSLTGEISGYREYPSGHRYFALKDEAASIRCVYFKFKALRLNFKPKDGMKVIAIGYVGLYEKDGQYQFYVESLIEAGSGALYADFLATKAKLEALGIFDQSHKRPLVKLPRKVGVVTSSAGSVIRDIINVTRRRFPTMDIVLCHASVQGEDAPIEICAAINELNKIEEVDVIIVGRGGGSAEDLSPFNSEQVAYAIFNSQKPIISAVGHETDYTIADLAADVRAPTPSAAAELAVAQFDELTAQLRDKSAYITRVFDSVFYGAMEKLRTYSDSGTKNLIYSNIESLRIKVESCTSTLNSSVSARLSSQSNGLRSLKATLDAANPYAVLKRGYAFIMKSDGMPLTRANACANEPVEATLVDGKIKLVVSEDN